MGGIIDSLKSLWEHEARHCVVAEIPAARTDPSVVDGAIIAEEHYVRVWLSEMFLKDDRRLFRTVQPVVHSSVRLTYGTTTKELPYVAGRLSLGLHKQLGKGAQLDHRLTNVLPFRGGSIDIATALVAYRDRDYFAGLLSVLSNVSGLLNVGQLSTTLKVVGGVVDGVQNLMGAADKEPHLLFYRGYGGSDSGGGVSLRPGYLAVVRGLPSEVDATRLWVKRSRLCMGPSLTAATPLDGYDYMLLRIERLDERDDFLAFEQFSSLLNQAIKTGVSDRQKGDALIAGVAALVWDSDDLTVTDRLRVAKAIRAIYTRTLDGGQTAIAASARAASAGDGLAAAIQSFDVDDARAQRRRHGLTTKSSLDSFLNAIVSDSEPKRRPTRTRSAERAKPSREKSGSAQKKKEKKTAPSKKKTSSRSSNSRKRQR